MPPSSLGVPPILSAKGEPPRLLSRAPQSSGWGIPRTASSPADSSMQSGGRKAGQALIRGAGWAGHATPRLPGEESRLGSPSASHGKSKKAGAKLPPRPAAWERERGAAGDVPSPGPAAHMAAAGRGRGEGAGRSDPRTGLRCSGSPLQGQSSGPDPPWQLQGGRGTGFSRAVAVQTTLPWSGGSQEAWKTEIPGQVPGKMIRKQSFRRQLVASQPRAGHPRAFLGVVGQVRTPVRGFKHPPRSLQLDTAHPAAWLGSKRHPRANLCSKPGLCP